jgi:hypothetical protein
MLYLEKTRITLMQPSAAQRVAVAAALALLLEIITFSKKGYWLFQDYTSFGIMRRSVLMVFCCSARSVRISVASFS